MSAKTFFSQECQLFVSVSQGNSLLVTAKKWSPRYMHCLLEIKICFFPNICYFLTFPNNAPCGLVNNKAAIISEMF